jgi:S1-C subfamily serine protease
VAIDDQSIDSSADLRNAVGLVRAGESVAVTAIRDGEHRTVRATVAPDVAERAATARAADPSSVSLLAGAAITELPRDHPGYGRVHGVWVNEVAPGSVAARFGLRTDDVITGVNRDSIESVADLTAELNDAEAADCAGFSAKGRAMFLLVR